LKKFLALVLSAVVFSAPISSVAAGPGDNPGASKAAAAQERAAAAKEASQAAAQEAASAKQEAASAAREAALAEKLTPGSAAEAAKAAAQERAVEARAAGIEASEKAKAAAEAYREAALARAMEKSNGRAIKALNKVKAAKDECVDYLEDPTAELAEECQPATYLVRFHNGVDAQYQAKAMRSAKFPVSQVFEDVISGALVELNAKQLATVANSGRIRTIEENFKVNLAETQINPDWGLDRIDQAFLPLSSSYTNENPGTGVKIYVVDTGIRSTHQELAGRVESGFSSISDGNGTLDCNGHGTHVSGIAAGTTYGVAKQATLVPVRVLGCSGEGNLSGVLAGLDWVLANHIPGTPGVVNMSLGGLASSTLDAAVQSLINRGITVVVAAGNSASDACLYSPARVSAAITVAASGRDDGFASFSNSGSCIDLVAPGVEITSSASSADDATAIYSGTSMAAPHVAGSVASLMTAGYMTPGEVTYNLSLAAAPAIYSAPVQTTNLLLQLASASSGEGTEAELPQGAATAPIAPVITSVNTWRNAARVNWEISPDGGSPLISQTVRIWERGQLKRKIEVSATATTAKISGLKWNVSYTFTVLATNEVGTSDDSLSTEVIVPTRVRR